MKTGDTVEYNSLNWVKKELDHVLDDAQKAFNSYIEDSSEVDKLKECIDQLHLIHGTLLMVELYGAAMLAEELEHLANALLNKEVEGNDEIYQLMMGGMLRLPDYLDGLVSGNKDIPIVLLPVLNDLRAARNESLLSENLLFFPDIEAADKAAESAADATAASSAELQKLAKRLRPHFQLGLVGWFKGDKPRSSLKRIYAVVNELEKAASINGVKRLWSVSAALLEALIQKGLESNVSIKLLLGKIDRLNKQLIDQGESALAATMPADILKNLLYYIARSESLGDRVSRVKELYRLNELLPPEASLEDSQFGLGGPNADLLQTVSQAIREDFTEVKDALEVFVHGEVRDKSKLDGMPELLNKIADTLGMLSLGAPRQMILDQKAKIEKFHSGESEATDQEVMDVASVLLSAEAKLNNYIARRKTPDEDEGTVVEEVPDSEYREVLSTVAREALQDFSQAKQAILMFADAPDDEAQLNLVLKLFGEAGGAMFMAPLDILAPLIRGISEYIEIVLLKNKQPVPEQLDVLADAVTSIEYYLESVVEGHAELQGDLEFGRRAVERLRNVTEKSKGSAPEPVVEETETAAEEIEIEAAPEITGVDEIEAIEPVEISIEEEPPAIELEVEPEIRPEAVADKPKPVAQAKPVREELAIISDDIDEEIFEIFIEEALEELGSISENLPKWQNNPDNEEAMTTVRRSFHTLKGSGRLIGAMMIGEFAWKIENLVNRVIDKSISVNQELFSVLDEAVAVLPQLIEQLKGNQEPVSNIFDLMDHADALSKGEVYSPPVDTGAAASASPDLKHETVAEETPLESATEAEEVSFDLGEVGESASIEQDDAALGFETSDLGIESSLEEEIEFDTTDIDLSVSDSALDSLSEEQDFNADDLIVEEEISFDGLEEPLSDLDIPVDLDDDLLAELESKPEEIESIQEQTPLVVNEKPEIPSKLVIDAELFAIFRKETEEHLNTIRDLLELHKSSGTDFIPNDELIRALHTLFGSARTAEVPEIADVCGLAEKFVKQRIENGAAAFDEKGLAALSGLVGAVAKMLNNLDQGMALQHDHVLQDTFNNLYHQELEQFQEQPVVEAVPDNSLTSYGDIDEELVEIFLEEAEDLIESAESSLLRWKADLNDEESVNELQRILHTLKGGARMAELAPIGDLTHALESLIIEVAETNASQELLVYVQQALDAIGGMLVKVTAREPIESAAALIAELNAVRKGGPVKKSETAIAAAQEAEEEISLDNLTAELADLEVEEDFDTDIETEFDLTSDETNIEEIAFDVVEEELPTDVLEVESAELPLVPKELPSVIEEQVAPQVITAEPEQQPAEPTAEIINLDVKPVADSGAFKIKEVSEAEETEDDKTKAVQQEQVRVRADLLNNLVNNAGEVNIYNSRFDQQLADFGFNLGELDQTVERLRDQLRKLDIETEAQILSTHAKETSEYDEAFDPLEMDRYSTLQQLSRSLMESVSDLESIKDLLANTVRESETLLLQQSRISTELQESLMRTRMVHFGGLSTRLRRIVRQTARELDKEAELVISGENTEVDRSILDRIVSPLEHMLRNAISHGIEKPDIRAAAKKVENGTITINVSKEGQDLLVKVEDDGAGINVNAIRKKALERGLMDANAELSDHEIVQFILESGFSTAENVTQIAGRGVGMDVVDSEIKQLGGTLDIQSRHGKGTTFIVRVPMSLSINQALLVHEHEDVFAVPLNSVEGVVRLSGYELQMFYDNPENRYEFADEKYEVKYLGFLLKGQQPDYLEQGIPYPVLLVRTGDQRVAVQVDSLVGRREIVVKPVGPQISTIRGVSGATILGDGRVVLILDMASLLRAKAIFHVEGAVEQIQQEAQKAVSDEITVMVVDDSITIRKVTERILARHGMQVITAKDGLDASAKLQERVPDIMLLDIEMPRMDGYELATMIRNNEHFKHLPIIMITSRTGSKHKEKAIEIGVNRYLGKPYQEDELMENITQVLEEEKAS